MTKPAGGAIRIYGRFLCTTLSKKVRYHVQKIYFR